MKLTKGVVYVISTTTYFEQSIFKIGFTKCIEKRLKQFNNTRSETDRFYLCFKHHTVNYKKLETMVHNALEPYKLKNELFQVPLSVIEQTIKDITNTKFFNHVDIVFDNACLHKLLWVKTFWLINKDNLQVFMNDSNLIDYIKIWLKPYDHMNLYKFISDNYYYSLLSMLKFNFVLSPDKEYKFVNLADLMLNLSLENTTQISVDGILNDVEKLKLEN